MVMEVFEYIRTRQLDRECIEQSHSILHYQHKTDLSFKEALPPPQEITTHMERAFRSGLDFMSKPPFVNHG